MKIGPYEVLSELGRGGMGVVFKGRSAAGALVAIKVLRRLDGGEVARFERERRLHDLLGETEGFVPLLDLGDAELGPYLVMPYVSGGTLRGRLARGPLGVEESIALARSIASALGRAHALGVVHRDLKPENVLFTEDGRPLVADLGLAKHFARGAPGASESVSISVSGTLRGTFGYMPPEQMRDAKGVGAEADVFALGAVLYECLAGVPPFAGATLIAVLSLVEEGKLATLRALRPEAPSWLEAVVARALSRRPEDRFRDGAELERALAAGSRRGAGRAASVAAALAGAAVLAGAAALASGALPPRGAHPPEPRSPITSSSVANAKTATAARSPAELAQEWLVRAEAHEAAGEHEPALAELERALALDPGNARALACRGQIRSEEDDLAGADADCKEALRHDPGLARAWTFLGVGTFLRHDYSSALSLFDRALAIDPWCIRALDLRGWSKVLLGDSKSGFADLAEATRVVPSVPKDWYYRGRVRANRPVEQAIADLTNAVSLMPRFIPAQLQLADARADHGDLDVAVELISRAIDANPRRASSWFLRGKTRTKAKALDEAIADLTRAIEIDPGYGNAFARRGLAKGEKGDVAGAIADLEQSTTLDPDDPDPAAIRAEIRRLEGPRPPPPRPR